MVDLKSVIRFTFSVLLLSFSHLYAGNYIDDMNFILGYEQATEVSPRLENPESTPQANEFKMAMTGAIRFYQAAISSQDLSVCVFQPSCSHFGMDAIRHYGPIHGLLMTSDRLLRCHSYGKVYYPYDFKHDKALDLPLENFYLFYDPRDHGSYR